MMIKVKVKLSCNKLWRLRGGIKHWDFIVTLKFGTIWTAELSAQLVSHTLPEENVLVLISVKRLRGLRDYRMQT
jgi:hypothetical protein